MTPTLDLEVRVVRGVTLQIGGVTVNEGDYLAGYANGVLVLEHPFNTDSTDTAD